MILILIETFSFVVVLNALRHLCTSTDILADPSRLPAEARAASNKAANRQSIS